jgi:hypothetical protein
MVDAALPPVVNHHAKMLMMTLRLLPHSTWSLYVGDSTNCTCDCSHVYTEFMEHCVNTSTRPVARRPHARVRLHGKSNADNRKRGSAKGELYVAGVLALHE